MPPDAEPLVAVENLTKHYPVMRGVLRRQVGAVRAVDGLDFAIHARETLGLVGESGCGKSTAGRVILRLDAPTTGRVIFRGADITALQGEALRQLRPDMQMIFQDPQDSLNPRMTVGSIVAEPLREHGVAAFQLPTLLICRVAPRAMSFNRERPRHMTMLPGGGSLARAR